MPAYTGPAANYSPDREVHGHRLVGVDVAIVPFADSHRHYRAVQEHASTAASSEASTHGDDVIVKVTTDIIGHDLPTGSAHARALWVHLRVVGADGEGYLESGGRDDNGDLRDDYSEIVPFGDPWFATASRCSANPCVTRTEARWWPPTEQSARWTGRCWPRERCGASASPSWGRVPARCGLASEGRGRSVVSAGLELHAARCRDSRGADRLGSDVHAGHELRPRGGGALMLTTPLLAAPPRPSRRTP
jgi:hypothetical protein